jgi:TusA-related sulfurtransferase
MPTFISALMPQPASASPASIVDLLQSGLKSAAANHEQKIKSVEDFIKLLSEQAKHIVQNKGDVTDFLLYSLNLTKYLTEYGLQATLYYHFELLKKMQAGEITQLHLDQPMIYINMTSRFSRLNQTNLLASQKIGSMSASTKSAYKSNAGRTAAAKFTGTPCPFHTKQLGKPANHSEADCRVKGGAGTKQ